MVVYGFSHCVKSPECWDDKYELSVPLSVKLSLRVCVCGKTFIVDRQERLIGLVS